MEAWVVVLGGRVHALRVERGWRLADLASRADLSESFVSQIEIGQRCPSLPACVRLSSALGVTLSELFVGLGV